MDGDEATAGLAAPALRTTTRFFVDPADTVYAALDLGTNNCRLLIAKPQGPGLRVVDSFSRIVRLGEGLALTGRLADDAMLRTLDALDICRRKIDEKGASRVRLVTTEACRVATNGGEFLARVRRETGLDIDLLTRQREAELAAAGCAVLADPKAESVVLFDIGGGSTEIVWLAVAGQQDRDIAARVRAWASLPIGVVNLADRHGGEVVNTATFEVMVEETLRGLADFRLAAAQAPAGRNFHLLGTSGTVTTLGGLHLGLERYDRRQVDGLWMSNAEVDAIQSRLLAMSYAERRNNGCIGRDRADLVLAGTAIFEAIRRAFPATRMRIGDRGLREGLLLEMMREDGALARAR
jgi:exopolyphosphatase/guanosine-5'-triphosphate,3'-diphosphate pyrophosphatase